jgi:hypothetical protein
VSVVVARTHNGLALTMLSTAKPVKRQHSGTQTGTGPFSSSPETRARAGMIGFGRGSGRARRAPGRSAAPCRRSASWSPSSAACRRKHWRPWSLASPPVSLSNLETLPSHPYSRGRRRAVPALTG